MGMKEDMTGLGTNEIEGTGGGLIPFGGFTKGITITPWNKREIMRRH